MATQTILLVDDDEVFRRSTRRLLEGMGYAVKCVAGGTEALKIVKSHQDLFRLVLLDMVMPGMDGEATFHALRESQPGINILLTSGNADASKVRALLDGGAVGFLQKPVDAPTLKQAISDGMKGR